MPLIALVIGTLLGVGIQRTINEFSKFEIKIKEKKDVD